MVRKLIKAWVFEWRMKRAIRKAKHDAELYGKKFLVLVFHGKPVVVSMQGIKQLIRKRRFSKDFTAEKAVKCAIYISYPNTKN
ncbi:hypothetical protein [Alistipes putredinis]|uniref:hypothetical protein n=1 Tax=Bacteroidales TaxID=171549 RepID=UPI003AAADFEF